MASDQAAIGVVSAPMPARSTPRRGALRTRLILGGIGGFVATAAMTAVMARLHRRLPPAEQYPLPPREITEIALGGDDDGLVRDQAMLAHFAYGAMSGALYAGLIRRPSPANGAAAGAAVWAGSYFGWVPLLRILRPASSHPARRNALMIAVHLVWGAGTAVVARELDFARRTILNDRPPRDAVAGSRRKRGFKDRMDMR